MQFKNIILMLVVLTPVFHCYPVDQAETDNQKVVLYPSEESTNSEHYPLEISEQILQDAEVYPGTIDQEASLQSFEIAEVSESSFRKKAAHFIKEKIIQVTLGALGGAALWLAIAKFSKAWSLPSRPLPQPSPRNQPPSSSRNLPGDTGSYQPGNKFAGRHIPPSPTNDLPQRFFTEGHQSSTVHSHIDYNFVPLPHKKEDRQEQVVYPLNLAYSVDPTIAAMLSSQKNPAALAPEQCSSCGQLPSNPSSQHHMRIDVSRICHQCSQNNSSSYSNQQAHQAKPSQPPALNRVPVDNTPPKCSSCNQPMTNFNDEVRITCSLEHLNLYHKTCFKSMREKSAHFIATQDDITPCPVCNELCVALYEGDFNHLEETAETFTPPREEIDSQNLCVVCHVAIEKPGNEVNIACDNKKHRSSLLCHKICFQSIPRAKGNADLVVCPVLKCGRNSAYFFEGKLDDDIPPSHSPHDPPPSSPKEEECSICYELLFSEDPKSTITLPCHDTHIFHIECISECVNKNGRKCPNCRAEIPNEFTFRALNDIANLP
jgi:Ring finger domain